MRTSVFSALGAALLAATVAVPASAAQLIVNGNFENTGFGGTSSYYNLGNTGATHAVPADFGFDVPINNVDLIANGVFAANLAGGGAYNLDLVGFGSTGAISQTFATTLGATYHVSLAYTVNGAGTADVSVDGSSIGSIVGTGTWQTFTNTFLGTGNAVTFAITELTGGGNGGVVLDNISVTSVPEPAMWGLMLVGFGLVGVASRRRTVVAA